MNDAASIGGSPGAAIRQLLSSMEGLKASDLFIVEGKRPAARIHGEVKPLKRPPVTAAEIEGFVVGAVLEPARRTFDQGGDLDFGYSLVPGGREPATRGRRPGTGGGPEEPGSTVPASASEARRPVRRFRFNLSRQQGALALAARALPGGDLTVEALGLPPEVTALASRPRGLVLVAGATGSGKSTSLAALVNQINRSRRVHVVTLEDPIEFVHHDRLARISQREVGTDTVDFQSALRHVVRQNPDVIVIGEMRDLETMRVALSAALTGHLVLATLHTIDVSQTLSRILAYFPEHLQQQAAMDLSLCLQGILSQRLLPRADADGRVMACELLTVSPAASRLIREQRFEDLLDYMKSTHEPGIVTFNKSLLQLYECARISYDVGQAYASNPDEFALAAKGMSTGTATFARELGLESRSGLDVKALLHLAEQRGASDLHLTVGRPPILRVNGELKPLGAVPLSTPDMRVLLFSIMSARQRTVFELDREIDFALAVDQGKRYRINAYHQKGKLAAALRSIPHAIPEAEHLGLPDVVLDLGLRPHGLLLVVGPTGSGKSTTLACLIERINRERDCRIITIEDPIEYVYEGKKATIDQREVHADTLSFAAALRNILRQDPDVILVGEMRDAETTAAAITASETGHLVMATLHTNDAVQAIDRIIDVFPPHQQPQIRSQLAAALVGVISQRLVQRLDGTGRVAAFEVLVGTMAMRSLIREGKLHQVYGMMETKRAEGMFTLDHSLKKLREQGVIDLDEALRYAVDPRAVSG